MSIAYISSHSCVGASPSTEASTRSAAAAVTWQIKVPGSSATSEETSAPRWMALKACAPRAGSSKAVKESNRLARSVPLSSPARLRASAAAASQRPGPRGRWPSAASDQRATARFPGENCPGERSTVDAATSSALSESRAPSLSPLFSSVANAHRRSVRSRGLNLAIFRSASAAIACISRRSLGDTGCACVMCSFASAKHVLESSWLLKWYSWRSASTEMHSTMWVPGWWPSAAKAHSRFDRPCEVKLCSLDSAAAAMASASRPG